jgi:hypothetical protein
MCKLIRKEFEYRPYELRKTVGKRTCSSTEELLCPKLNSLERTVTTVHERVQL